MIDSERIVTTQVRFFILFARSVHHEQTIVVLDSPDLIFHAQPVRFTDLEKADCSSRAAYHFGH